MSYTREEFFNEINIIAREYRSFLSHYDMNHLVPIPFETYIELREKLWANLNQSEQNTKKKTYTIKVQMEDEDVEMDYELKEDEFLLIKEISEDVERYSFGKRGGISITELTQ